MAGEQDLSEAARTIYETGQTKKGRLGYILVLAVGFILGASTVLVLFKGCLG